MAAIKQLSLFAEPAPNIPTSIGQARVSILETLHLLTPGKGRTGGFDYTLNPYRGCSFGCSYCYAAFFEPDLTKRRDWGYWVEVKHRAVEALAKTDLRGKTIFMSSVTDPYQPIENKIGLTRSIVEHLAKVQAKLVVQTRSPFVTRDIDLFQHFQNVRINMSITTDSDEVRKRYEPNCASIEKRLEAVAKVKAAGLRAHVCVAPMLPMRDPEAFGRLLAEIGVDSVGTVWFDSSPKAEFASNTRAGAYALAQQDGWTHDQFMDCTERLKRSCRRFGSSREVFGAQPSGYRPRKG
jgi:DNA repair photolyase